jgi:hypothetical protein
MSTGIAGMNKVMILTVTDKKNNMLFSRLL